VDRQEEKFTFCYPQNEEYKNHASICIMKLSYFLKNKFGAGRVKKGGGTNLLSGS